MKTYFFKLGLIAVITFVFAGCRPSVGVVRTRPHAPVAVHNRPPGPSYVWVDGDWILRGNRYVYRQGYWAIPSRKDSYWLPGHWEPVKRGYSWVPGRWK